MIFLNHASVVSTLSDLYFLPFVPRADLVYLHSSWRVFSLLSVFMFSDSLCLLSLAVLCLAPLLLPWDNGWSWFMLLGHPSAAAGRGGLFWMCTSLCCCGGTIGYFALGGMYLLIFPLSLHVSFCAFLFCFSPRCNSLSTLVNYALLHFSFFSVISH